MNRDKISKSEFDQSFTIEILPIKGQDFVNWKELLQYRDLLFFLVWRQIKARYAQSVLGIGWAIINPLLQMLIFTVIFGQLAQIDSDGAPYAVFSYVALVPWTYFAGGITNASQSMINASNLISKVYFPRLILPLSAVLDQLIDFTIALTLVFVLLILYQITPSLWILFLPVLVIIMVLCTAGVGMILGAMSIQYRDIAYSLGLGTRLLMYAAPVVYPASLVPEPLRPFYALNPMAGVIEGFRSAILQTNPMPWDLIIIGGISSILFFIIGLIYFRRREHIFADIV